MRWLIFCFLVWIMGCVDADAAVDMDYTNSNIEFSITMGKETIPGVVPIFEADIVFDPTSSVDVCKVGVKIYTAVIATPYKEVNDTLHGKDWLDSKTHPIATFTGSQCSQVNENLYILEGELALKAVTAPLVLTFKYHAKEKDFVVDGKTRMARSVFGLGINEKGVSEVIDIQFHLEGKQQ